MSTIEITASGEGMYSGHGARKCSFPATRMGYFAFKHLLRCSDDRSLSRKIPDPMGFWTANRLRVYKVRLFFCAAFIIIKRVTGATQYRQKKPRLNR